MGLDMYLNRRVYVGNKWKKDDDKVTLQTKDPALTKLDVSKLSEISCEAGYWRKANHIHKWFVDNVQGGEDNCKEYYVSSEKLQELLDICKKIIASTTLIEADIVNGYTFKDGLKVAIMEKGKKLKDPTVANSLLPTTEGFFFGSTDYDEYYWQDILDTIDILESALKNTDGDFYYQSSW